MDPLNNFLHKPTYILLILDTSDMTMPDQFGPKLLISVNMDGCANIFVFNGTYS